MLKAAAEESLDEAGELGGGIGGAIGGTIGAGPAGGFGGWLGGGSGGRTGGRFGVRLLKAQTAEATVEAPRDSNAIRELAERAIAESGQVIEDPNTAGDGSVWGIVRSGTWNMMPALVRVEIEVANGDQTRVRIRASGKEGLIKQGIGAKAADRIAEAISIG